MASDASPCADLVRARRWLLLWYRRHGRVLPWRGGVGRGAARDLDPYRVWLSEIMLQQTTVATACGRWSAMLARFPDVAAFARAPQASVMAAWAGLGYYRRARLAHLCAKAVVARGGFPNTEAGLAALPGIGAYTAAAVAAIAFGRPSVPLDVNIMRVARRLLYLPGQAAPVSPAQARTALAGLFARRSGDVAQALMDIGATLCRPRAWDCAACPLARVCSARAHEAQALASPPAQRRVRPWRYGAAFWLENAAGAVWITRRPSEGLLGGMEALPSSEWREDQSHADALAQAPIAAAWRKAGEVVHGFTHFKLALTIYWARLPADALPPRGGGGWRDPAAAFKRVPSVMRKAWPVAASAWPVAARA